MSEGRVPGCLRQLSCPSQVLKLAPIFKCFFYYSIGVLYVKYRVYWLQEFRVKGVISIIIASFFVIACQPTEPPYADPAPIEVSARALQFLEEDLTDYQEPDFRTYDLSEIRLENAQLVELNRADELNNINEKWCISFRYIGFWVTEKEYFESWAVYLLSAKEGDWIVREIYSSKESSSGAESLENSWDACLLQ